MKMATKSKYLCYFCKSEVNVGTSDSSVEICDRFQIYTTKFLKSSSCQQEKFDITGQSINHSGNDENCKNKIISSCVKCATEIETFCEMWESLESLQGEMICEVVNISNLTKHKLQSKSEIAQQSPPHCFICQAVLRLNFRRKKSEIETCLKFITFVTRFVLNTEKPCFEKKILKIVVEWREIRNFVSVHCCDICLTELVTFCEMYEALDSLRLEILRILDRISNKSKSKHFQSSVDKCRKLSFPRVKLEKLPCIDLKLSQIQVQPEKITINQEFSEVAELESDPTTESEDKPNDDDFDNIEMESNGIPTPSPSLLDNGEVENEAVSSQIADIFQSHHVTVKTKKCEGGGGHNRKIKRKPPFHSPGYKGACLFCEKYLDRPSRMEQHTRSHTGERGFICRICLQEFSIKQRLLLHRRSCHFREENAPAPIICEICGKFFDRKGRLIEHVQAVHEKLKPHKCDICDKNFSWKSNMEIHRRLHTVRIERPHSCDICGKTFSWKCSVKLHKRAVHEGIKKKKSQIHDNLKIEKKFKCSVADCSRKEVRREFSKVTELEDFAWEQSMEVHHQRLHTDRLSCDICGKTFTHRSSVNVHKRAVHEGIKRKPSKSYVTLCRQVKKHKKAVHNPTKVKPMEVCHLCGKTVGSYKNSLLKHLNEYHRSEIDDSLKLEKSFKCSVADCPWAFYERGDLRRHTLTHTGERKFQCDQCGKAFTLQFQLKTHKEVHKEVRPYVCDHCGKGFNLKHRLKGHLKKYHSSDNVTSNRDDVGN